MLARTWPRRGGKGAGGIATEEVTGRWHGQVRARPAVGDGFLDKTIGGGEVGGAAADEATGRPRKVPPSVNKADADLLRMLFSVDVLGHADNCLRVLFYE